eukprot:UN00028
MIPFAADTKQFYEFHQKRKIYVRAIKNKCLLQNNGFFRIRIQNWSYPVLLQTKIAKLLDDTNSIDPSNIVLLQHSNVVDSTQCIRNESFDYELMPFDARLYDQSVVINIFKPSECPHPVYNKNKKGISFRVLMINNQNYDIQQFIHYVFDTIRDLKGDHILHEYYEQVLDIFDDLDASKCVLAPTIPADNLSLVPSVGVFSNYNSSHQLLPTGIKEFDLFLNGTVSSDVTAYISLIIRFLAVVDNEWKYVGMSLS